MIRRSKTEASSDVSERRWPTLFIHHNGKEHSSGTDAVWCDPQGVGGNLLLLVLCRCLFTVVLLILLDQELLGGPPQLPALHLPLCGFHHYGGQAVLQFAAAVKV